MRPKPIDEADKSMRLIWPMRPLIPLRPQRLTRLIWLIRPLMPLQLMGPTRLMWPISPVEAEADEADEAIVTN